MVQSLLLLGILISFIISSKGPNWAQPLVSAFFISTFLGLIIGFLITKQKALSAESPAFWIPALGIFLIWSGLELFAHRRPKKCRHCQKPGRDLMKINNKEKRYCRNHLLREFKDKFLAFPYKTIVVYPNFEKIDQPMYYYAFCPEV